VFLCFAFWFVYLRAVTSSQHGMGFWIVHSRLSLRVFSTFYVMLSFINITMIDFYIYLVFRTILWLLRPTIIKCHGVNWGKVRYLSYSFRINVNIFRVMLFSLLS
jgi:hypothetical protein